MNHFEGKAKTSLTSRLFQNELKIIGLNKRFDNFMEEFITIFSIQSK